MKKSIFLFFAAILCAMSVGAVDMTGGEVLYLTPNSNWLQEGDGKAPRFAAYFYGTGNAWESMTAVEGETNLYQLSVPAGNWTNVIFCRMNGNTTENNWDNKYNQTNDLAYDGTNNHYTVTNGAWSNGDGTWSVYTPGAEKTYKNITITVTANSTPQIHYWSGGDKMTGSVWENLPTMTATANANEYTYTINDVDESTGVNYLLKIGDIQTADQHTTENVTADFKDLLVEVKVQGIDGWQGGIKMTPSDDYLSASVTYPLGANLSVDLKLTVGGYWFGDTKNAITKENNSTVFDSNGNNGSIKTDISGDYVFTYTYATKTLTVTYPTEEVEVEVNCYVIGNENLTGVNWVVPGEIEMTKDEETGLYTHTFTSCPANTPFEMQVYYANTYKGFNCLSDIAEGITANGDNICFTLVEAGDVTVTYNAETDKIAITSTVDFVAPEKVDNVTLYFVNYDGWTDLKAHVWNAENNQPLKSWDNSDSMTDTEIDHNGFDVYSYEFPETYNRIIFKGNGQQTGDEVATYNVAKPYYCQGTWYATLDEIPAPDPLATNIYLAGSMTNWAEGKIEFMKETPDATIATVAVELPVGDNTFKIMNGENWLGNGGTVENSITGWTFKEGDGDCTLKATYAATYVFTWDLTKEDQQLSVTYPTVEELSYTGLDKYQNNMGLRSYTCLQKDENTAFFIYNFQQNEGSWDGEFIYGDEFNVTGNIGEVSATGTGSWKLVDGVETLSATLINDNKTTIYFVTATARVPQTYTLSCTNAHYVELAWGGTTYTGTTTDGDKLTIEIFNGVGAGTHEGAILNLNDYEVTAEATVTVTASGTTLTLTGAFVTEIGDTYNVTLTATPKPNTPLVVENANFAVADGTLTVTGAWNATTVTVTIANWDGDGTYSATLMTGTGEGDDDIYAVNEATISTTGSLTTLTGVFENWDSSKYDVTISGTLPTELATITLTTGNNDDVIAANIGKTVNVVIERSFTVNAGYYTLCVPFNMPASVIGKAYSLGTITEHVSGEGININLEEESELSAGVPYLVLPKANMSELVVENVTIQSDIASGQNIYSEELNVNIFFEGFYSASGQTNGTTQYYVGNNGYLYNGEVEIRGLCGLFTITDKGGNSIKVRARVVTREEVETGLDNNQLPNTNIQKVLENGQLIIIREGVKYNVQGQKL